MTPDPMNFRLYAFWIVWWVARNEALRAVQDTTFGHRRCDWVDVSPPGACETCGEYGCECWLTLGQVELCKPETDQGGVDLAAIVSPTPRGRWLRRRIRRAIRAELAKAPGIAQDYATPTLAVSAPLLGPGARELGYPRLNLRGLIARAA